MLTLFVATILHCGWSYAAESEYLIIVNQDNAMTAISNKELARLFLGKKTMWDSNILVMPVFYNQDNQITRDFIQQVLRKSLIQYRTYWKRRLFSGAGVPPRGFRVTREILEYVSENPGAIGVVKGTVTDAHVKVIMRSD